MKNTVTMAELMKKVQAYGQPQNLDEGFASDAQRRAAFAQGYKAKGKKDKKEETLDEKLSTSQLGTLKKTFEPLRGKKIGPNAQDKLMKIMDKLDKDKDTLGQLVKADIPFVTQLAITRLISKHNMKAPEINKLREEFTMDDFAENEDNNYHTENALELAKKYGSRSEIMRMEKIKKDHDRKRSISEKDQKERDAIIKKYYSKLKSDYGSSPYDRQYEETELDEALVQKYVLINMQGKVQGYASDKKGALDIARRTKSTMHPIKKKVTDKTLEKMNALARTPKELKDLGIIEELGEMSYKPGSFKDTRAQEKGAKALADLAKTGGIDKKTFEKARSLYVQASDPASREKLKKFIFNQDTEPKEEIMNVIGMNDPETFLQMYPNAQRGEPLTRVSFAHRNMKSEEIEEKVDMQTKSYIDDIVSAINRDPKMKGLKPIAQKFKDLAMKTGDVGKSLKDVVTKEIGSTSILRGLTARLLNMSDSIPETQPKFDETDKEVEKAKKTANKMVSVAKAENLDLVNAAANVLSEKKEVREDGHTDVASAFRQCKTMIEDAMQISSKLQTMNPEESLPSWWTNKLAIASNNMNKLRDYFLVPTTESLEDELDEAKLNIKKIHKAVDDGKSMDVIVGMFADKRTTNTDEIRKIVKDYKFKKRMKEEVELNEKDGDIPDLKNLVGELTKASGMHLAQSKRVQAHVDMMVRADHPPEPNVEGGLEDLKKIVGELEKASEAHKRQSKSIDAHVKHMEKMEMKEYIEDELDERQHTNVSKKDADKVNSEMSKILGKIRFTHVPNTKGGIFKLPPNVKHEITVDRNDMKDAAALLMKDKGDVGFMFKQGLIRITPSMAREVKEWFSKYNCDVKVREIHEGSNVYQAYVPISKTIPNKLRHLTLQNQYGMIPEDVENLDNINYKNIKETSITMNGDFWNKLLTAYEEK